jgi:hypothetical protein
MDSESDRLKLAHWILERNLHWIAASEVKLGVVVAVDTAMLGGLAAAFSAADAACRTPWAVLCTVVAAVCLGCGVFCAAMAVLPRVTGPPTSFIFFGGIVKRAAHEYAEAFRKASVDQLLSDCLAQIHRNAEIACEKFQWVRAGMFWSFAAVLPWIASLALLINK